MKNNPIRILINEKDANKRLDVVLAEKLREYTRSNLKKIIKEKNIKINNKKVTHPSTKVKIGDKISILIKNIENIDLKPFKLKLDIIFEDKDLLIVNKPSGMVVHPGAGNYKKTLVNGLIHKYKKNLSDINGDLRPGIVHRIDKETSGLLVVAKNNFSHFKLSKQFSDHTIQRTYIALVWGVVRPLRGKIETLISRDKFNRQLMAVSDNSGKKAITNYKILQVFSNKNLPKISLIEFNLETGRTHQIRVHMKFKGTSILGDKQYGKAKLNFKKIDKKLETKLKNLDGQVLHAKSLGFYHPRNNAFLKFDTGIPNKIKGLVDLLKKLSI
jgi:23S rRNA pseudouridine1911/1915/1917 synthase